MPGAVTEREKKSETDRSMAPRTAP